MVELVCSDEVISPLLGHPRYLTIRRVVINSQTPQTPLSWLKINIDLLCSDSSGSEWRTKVSCITFLSNTRGGAPCLALYLLCLARISFLVLSSLYAIQLKDNIDQKDITKNCTNNYS